MIDKNIYLKTIYPTHIKHDNDQAGGHINNTNPMHKMFPNKKNIFLNF